MYTSDSYKDSTNLKLNASWLIQFLDNDISNDKSFLYQPIDIYVYTF